MALLVPAMAVVLVAGLWSISDRTDSIGPLDRAAFGWAVLVPLWLAGPVAAGLTWRRLTEPAAVLAALVVAGGIAAAVALAFWRAVASPDCAFGPARTPAEWVVPSLILGAVVGVGFATSAHLVTGAVRFGRPWRAAAIGVSVQALALVASLLVLALLTMGPGCQRPTIQ